MARVKVNTLVYKDGEPLSRLVQAGEEIPEGWAELKAPEPAPKPRVSKKRGANKNTTPTA